ncbi:serine/threonine/tyrosine-protein kinase HT1-like [Penaeus monodon]|uniref:serine/threonine/tyrosine-protein kinase HT1-like n=1 Tax=Penaeus monodon TaxID=6687 RepID=UPI0018A793C2|nr:serine/threonine/tyrosine-protein kinase HT1-like [Penaeus monodon]
MQKTDALELSAMAQEDKKSQNFVLEAEQLEEVLRSGLKEKLGEGASGKALLVRWGEGDAVLKLAHSGVLDNSKLSDDELLRLSLRLCVAVQEVHDRGYIHNDLMDDNVVVDEATGRVSIIDFGNACRRGQSVGYSASSNDNLAPEILGGGPSTAASDVFSVGYMLEQILDEMAQPSSTLGRLAREMQSADPRRRPTLPVAIYLLDSCYLFGDDSESESEDESQAAPQKRSAEDMFLSEATKRRRCD